MVNVFIYTSLKLYYSYYVMCFILGIEPYSSMESTSAEYKVLKAAMS